jgi:hypothetical protein
MSDPFEAAGFTPSTSPEGQPAANDPFASAGFTPSGQISGGQAFGAAREGLAYGTVKTSGSLAGAALGAKGGMALGALTGPAAPVMVPLLGLAGGLGGAYFGAEGPGEMAAEGLGLRSPDQMLPVERPYGYFGESIAGSATVVGSVYSLSRTGIRFMDEGVGKFANQVLDFALRRPKTFVATELGSAVTAATGAAAAEALLPGETGFRLGAEMAGGVFGPRIIEAVATRTYTEMRRLVEGFTQTGAESGAVRMIQEVFERTGGDISAVARAYREAGIIPTGDLTPAQKTGSPELAAIEEYSASLNKEFGRKIDKRFADALDVVRGNIAQLSATGDPNDLAMAMKMQKDFFEGLMHARAQESAVYAQQQAARISTQGREGIATESTKINQIVQDGIKLSRAHEDALWKSWLSIDGQQPTTAKNLTDSFRHHQEKLDTWSNQLPNEVRQFLKNLEGPPTQSLQLDERTGLMTLRDAPGESQASTAQQMWNQRSQILSEMRKAQSGVPPDHNKARILNDLAEAITRDLEGAMTADGRAAYDNARAFTKEFYDTYQRSFVGRTQGAGAYGDRMAPELIGNRVFSGPDEAVLIKLDELEEATRFIQRHGLGGDTAVRDMFDAQEKIARIVSTNVIDASTGNVDPAKIDKLLKAQPGLFNRFPELKADLVAAKTSESAARNIQRIGQGQEKTMETKIFARILKKEPLPVAMEVLASPNMQRDLEKFMSSARPIKSRSGAWIVSPEAAQLARQGAASSVLEGALRMSLNKEGVLNPAAFRALIDRPAVPGQKSALQVMQESGAITAKQASNIKRLFNEFDSLLSTTRYQTTVQVTPDIADAGGAVLARMLGSGAAGSLARSAGSSTPSLIVHGAGARFFEHVYTKLGVTTAARFLSEAMLDPAKADLLLQKASTMTPVQRAQANRRIHAWLVQSGLGLAEETGAAVERDLQPYMQPPEAPQMFTQPR